MNMLKKYRFVYVILATVFLLTACFPAATSDGLTIDATQAAELIETAVAQALNAQATQNAAAVPQATATPLPTNTPPEALPPTHTLVPTITPLVLVPTATVASSGGGYVPVKENCDPDIAKRPFDNTEMRPGDPFDIWFTIENTGTDTWAAGKDLVYFSGPVLTDGGVPATVQLGEMKPGARQTFGPYDATAPMEKGFHVMTFKLEGGFCWPYVAIIVE